MQEVLTKEEEMLLLSMWVKASKGSEISTKWPINYYDAWREVGLPENEALDEAYKTMKSLEAKRMLRNPSSDSVFITELGIDRAKQILRRIRRQQREKKA